MQGTPGEVILNSDTISPVPPQKQLLKLPATRGPYLQAMASAAFEPCFALFCLQKVMFHCCAWLPQVECNGVPGVMHGKHVICSE